MKLVTYRLDRELRAGIVVDERVVDVRTAAEDAGLPSDAVAAAASVRGLLGLAPADRERIARAARAETGRPLAELDLAPPVPDPAKILCIGLNYREHAAEADQPVPDAPIVFTKFATSLVGDGDGIRLPGPNPEMVDYEGELAVVIGRRATAVSRDEALDHVAGYMPFNDVSARDLQLASPQWTMGKAFDTSGPCGPVLVTADEVGDPQSLALRTLHNGEVVQESTTDLMIFAVADLVSYISSLITLEVGDVIATGTPAGVGHVRVPPRYLNDGDTIAVEIPGVGTLSNPVVGAAGPGSRSTSTEEVAR